MAALAPEAQRDTPGEPESAVASPPRPVRRWIRRGAAGVLLASGLALGGGFVWFAMRVPAEEVKLDRAADGIVVLTGGASRIADAIELLASGRGQRLLITGVHQATRWGEISRLLPEHEQLVRCCVDLDRSAINTLGNAVQARRWAEQRGFKSLIIVTSNYHMPRAMAEVGHQLPTVLLIPFPVITERLRSEPWWHGTKARLLLSEYVKYIYAMARMRVDPDAVPGWDGTSAPSFPLFRMSAHRSRS